MKNFKYLKKAFILSLFLISNFSLYSARMIIKEIKNYTPWTLVLENRFKPQNPLHIDKAEVENNELVPTKVSTNIEINLDRTYSGFGNLRDILSKYAQFIVSRHPYLAHNQFDPSEFFLDFGLMEGGQAWANVSCGDSGDKVFKVLYGGKIKGAGIQLLNLHTNTEDCVYEITINFFTNQEGIETNSLNLMESTFNIKTISSSGVQNFTTK